MKYVTQVQQQRPESPTVTLTWHACKYKVHELEDVPLVEFMYLVFTCMSGELPYVTQVFVVVLMSLKR